jgi:hypothetical protein
MPSQGVLSAPSGKRITAPPCSPAVCRFFKVSRAGQLLPLGSASAPSFSTTLRFLLRRVPPGILSAPAHLPEVPPHYRAFFRTLPLILRMSISAHLSDSSLPKVHRPLEGFPVRSWYLPSQAFLTAPSFFRTSRLCTCGRPLAANATGNVYPATRPVPPAGFVLSKGFSSGPASALPGLVLPCLFPRLRSFTPNRNPSSRSRLSNRDRFLL